MNKDQIWYSNGLNTLQQLYSFTHTYQLQHDN